MSVDEEAVALAFERFPEAKLLFSGISAPSPSSCGAVETTSCVERRRVVLLVLAGPGSPALGLGGRDGSDRGYMDGETDSMGFP